MRAMQAAPSRSFQLAELARIAGVSQRTLQRQFQKTLGKSPLGVLADIRFEHARRRLLQAAPNTSVTEVALRSGFTHLGRFSVEYARRYDEKPSQTLQRQGPSFADCPPCSIVPAARDWPSIAIADIETIEHNREIADGLVDELAAAFTRSGITITEDTRVARYHLHCALRGLRRNLVFTVRLIEMEAGGLIWAHQQELNGLTCLDEQLAMTLVAALHSAMRAAEIQRVQQKPDAELTPHDLALRALPDALALNPEANNRALELLGRAMIRDPGSQLAIALKSYCHAQRATYHFGDTPAQDRQEALNLGTRLIAVGSDADVLSVLGNALSLCGKLDMAELAARKALAICGTSSWAWARSGMIQVCRENAVDGIERLSIALDLGPNDPLRFNTLNGLGAAHFQAGRYRDAARWLERAVWENPSAVWQHQFLCPAYVLGGSKDNALQSLSSLQSTCPHLTISRVVEGLSFFTQSFRDNIANGLEAAGLPA